MSTLSALFMQQGMPQGEEKVLERQVTRRPGTLSEATRNQLKSADIDQLERWADNILDSKMLGDVFRN